MSDPLSVSDDHSVEIVLPTKPAPLRPPYLTLSYRGERLYPVPFSVAQEYFRYVSENSHRIVVEPNSYALCLPEKITLNTKCLGIAIDLLINGNIKVKQSDMIELLRASHFLKFDFLETRLKQDVGQMCKSHLRSLLHCLTVVQEWHTSDTFRQQIFDIGLRRFPTLLSQPDWPSCSADLVHELLMDDRMQATERQAFDAVMNWLAGNPDRVIEQVDRLLSLVRFSNMSTKQKVQCLLDARRMHLHGLVKPHVIKADWFRTCMELNAPQFTDMNETYRLNKFINESRRQKALESHRSKSKSKSRLFKVDQRFEYNERKSDVTERIEADEIDDEVYIKIFNKNKSKLQKKLQPNEAPPIDLPSDDDEHPQQPLPLSPYWNQWQEMLSKFADNQDRNFETRTGRVQIPANQNRKKAIETIKPLKPIPPVETSSVESPAITIDNDTTEMRTSSPISPNFALWQHAMNELANNEMPPTKAEEKQDK